jgi:NitT/TauT family transport system permease protein
MAIKRQNTYGKNEAVSWSIPSSWDLVALIIVFSVLVLLGLGAKAMLGHYQLGQVIPISLSPENLPYYALRSVLRMLIALLCSLIFTLVVGALAAKSKRAEKIIIPAIDILQSLPVLGYLTITLAAFIYLFRGSMLGPECAAIFTIFTAQVWNMVLSFYQSLQNVPDDLLEASRMFRLNRWQTFWRIEVPYAMPGLIWNMMMSMSGSWVFLVASEAISVANKTITLPGIGSYISLAIMHKDVAAICYVIMAMFIVILIYDQLIFRPLVAWSVKFKPGEVDDENAANSWIYDVFQRSRWFSVFSHAVNKLTTSFINIRFISVKRATVTTVSRRWSSLVADVVFYLILFSAIVLSAIIVYRFIFEHIAPAEIQHVVYLGLMTALRIVAVILISSCIWVPIGVWIGSNAKAARIVQPVAQFLAAFPVNLLFPVAAMLIYRYHLNVNVWCSPLMILGTQWYILFNIIAGASAIPKNLRYAVGTLNVTGYLKWKKFILPAVFPYFVTGAITAAGGAWNISIVAESISWGHNKLYANGIGAYIHRVVAAGDFHRLALGISVMALYVLVFNRLLWRPLYRLSQKRYQI